MCFQAIVKLFPLFEGRIGQNVTQNEATWATATWWLATGDDHSKGLERLIKAEANIDYSVKNPIGTAELEFRLGTSVATIKKWINTSGGHEPSDIAFIELRSTFDSIAVYLNCIHTPISQTGAVS